MKASSIAPQTAKPVQAVELIIPVAFSVPICTCPNARPKASPMASTAPVSRRLFPKPVHTNSDTDDPGTAGESVPSRRMLLMDRTRLAVTIVAVSVVGAIPSTTVNFESEGPSVAVMLGDAETSIPLLTVGSDGGGSARSRYATHSTCAEITSDSQQALASSRPVLSDGSTSMGAQTACKNSTKKGAWVIVDFDDGVALSAAALEPFPSDVSPSRLIRASPGKSNVSTEREAKSGKRHGYDDRAVDKKAPLRSFPRSVGSTTCILTEDKHMPPQGIETEARFGAIQLEFKETRCYRYRAYRISTSSCCP